MTETIDVYALEWTAVDTVGDDDDDGQCEVRAYGRDADGRTAAVRVVFFPYFFVKVPREWSEPRVRAFVYECTERYGAHERYSLPVSRKDAWGYAGGASSRFVQLAFSTTKAARITRSRLRKTGMETYEGSVDPVIRLCHVRGISPVGWFRATGTRVTDEDGGRIAERAEVELRAHFLGVGPCPTPPPRPPPIVLCSWDIECYSASGAFPQAANPDDAVIQIASSFQRLGEPAPYRTLVVALDTCDDVPGIDIVAVATEAELIHTWIAALRDEGADVLLGWNTWQFDWRYVAGRLAVLTDDSGEPTVDTSGLGRGGDGAGSAREWELNSGAYGQNTFFVLRAPGVLDLDLMQLTRRDHKLESYSLNNVSAKFLGEQKLDLPAGQIFAKFKGSSADRADIARYAAQDVALPLKLLAKLSIFDNLAQMAIATCVPVDYLLSRGQQIKVFSLILKQAREMGYLLPDDKGITCEGKYEGATVLDAKRGAYFDVISGLDFASLYPSIIRAHRMCYSTLVLPGSPQPPEAYEIETGLGTYAFAQDPAVPGIVPELLRNLAQWRKDAKRKMAAATSAGDAWGASVWNGAQLAFKVSMNSVYGFLGASKGFLPCVPIAAAVTATGRAMIERTKSLAESMVPGSEVIYGDTDSVMVRFHVADPDKRLDVATHFEIARRVAEQISETFPAPIELEFEKCYLPYLLFAKKRYCGGMYTRPDRMDAIDVKGIQLVRRDCAPIVKTASQNVLNALMLERSTTLAIAAARAEILRVLERRVPLADFVLSKTLRTGYKSTAQPHVAVARKLRERTGVGPHSGERVPYVFLADDANPDALQVDRAEHPDHVRHVDDLDVLYYIDHQLKSPLIGLLELVVDDPEAELFERDPAIAAIMTELRTRHKTLRTTAKRIRTNQTKNQHEITKFFTRTKL